MEAMFGRRSSLTTITGEGNEVSIDDGHRVLQALHPTDAMETLTVDRIRRAANSTHQLTGDGTSTTAILCAHLLSAKYEDHDHRREVAEELRANLPVILDKLRSRAMRGINRKRVMQVVKLAMHAHPFSAAVGKLVWELGESGSVTIEPVSVGEFSAEKVGGYQWGGGVDARKFNRPRSLELGESLVLVCHDELDDVAKQLRGVLSAYMDREGRSPNPRPLLVFAPSVAGSAMATLNNASDGRVVYPTYIIRPPAGNFASSLEDLAMITGAKVFSRTAGVPIEGFGGINDFGVVSKAVFGQSGGVVVPLAERAQVASKLASELVQDGVDKRDERIVRLRGSIGIIKVPATSDTVFKNLREVIDDGYRAGVSAIQHGVLPGAGRAYFDLAEYLGYSEYPVALIEALQSISKILGANYISNDGVYYQTWTGGYYRFLSDNEVWDNAYSVIQAVENAINEAALLLQTKYFIVYE